MQIIFFDIEYLVPPLLAHVYGRPINVNQNGKKLQYERTPHVYADIMFIMYVFLLICKLANIFMSVELKNSVEK